MKKTICSMALVFSVLASGAYAFCGNKVVVNCEEQVSSASPSGYALDVLQVFQEVDGSYRYSASITPINESGAVVGAPTYSSSGEAVTTTDDFGVNFTTGDKKIGASAVGCGHVYVFDDQKQDVGMDFDLSSCQFN